MKLTYIKSLDGIRGVFCIAIIVGHWKLAFPILPIGWEVLQIFFVLSGFLITRILLHEKTVQPAFGGYIKKFVWRRSFRIFPLYFAYVGIMSLSRFILKGSEFVQNQTRELEHSTVWLYTYLYNFKTWFNFKAGTAFEDTPFFSHLWSLSLEEQFYLFFPFIIYFLHGRVLKTVILLLIIVPQFIRFFGYPYLMSVNPDANWATLLIYRNIIFQFDSLALGAAFAMFNMDWIERPKRWFYATLALIIGYHIISYPVVRDLFTAIESVPDALFLTNDKMNILGYIHFIGHPEILQYNYQYIFMIPLVNICVGFMILCSLRDQPLGKRLFESNSMVYLGKISYGMYVFHAALGVIFIRILRMTMPQDLFMNNYLIQFLLFMVYLGVVIGVSHLSFKYFESIFLKIKSRIGG